jgi:hypothetical protein
MAQKAPTANGKPVSKEIDAIIKKAGTWKGKKLTELRIIIRKTDADLVEEVKWKMPSKPEGVVVWSGAGIVCHADVLKNAVRLNFHQGAQMKDPKDLFNARLDSKTVRAIDFGEDDPLNKVSLEALIREAVRVNRAKDRQ